MIVDLPALGYSRIYNQYRNSPKAVEWLLINPTIGSEFAETFDKISMSYDIDSNEGAQLDVIGRLIGTDRSAISSTEFTVYECGDDSVECGNDEAQCSPVFIYQDTELEDEYFRLILKSKVAKNTSNATIDSIIQATQIIVGSNSTIRLQDNEDMTFSIEIYDGLTDISRTLLSKNLIPKPQGVRLLGVLDGIGIVESGDDSLQCGDESAECVGFIEV